MMFVTAKHRIGRHGGRKRPSALPALICGLALASALAPQAGRAEGTVTNCTEASLRAALTGGGRVVFSNACTLSLTGSLVITNDTVIDAGTNRVQLTGPSPLLLISSGVTFEGAGLILTNCLGTNGGAMYISQDASVTLTNCTLAGNRAKGADGKDGVAGADSSWGNGSDGTDATGGQSGQGGAIYNLGTLALLNCVLSTNSATGGTGGDGGDGGTGNFNGGNGGNGGAGARGLGGAVYNLGTLLASNCSFIGNSAIGGHGGFGGFGGTGSTTNAAGRDGEGAAAGAGNGGAVCSPGILTVVNCTFAYNNGKGGDSGDGGTQMNGNGTEGPAGGNSRGAGLWTGGDAAVTNSTFFSNKVTGGAGGYGGEGWWNAGDGGNGGEAYGGGIFNNANLVIVNCTVTSCGAYGGTNGIAGQGSFDGQDGSIGAAAGGDLANTAGNRLILKNSIVAVPLAGSNIDGTYNDAGNNVRSNPKLGALANNGGPTLTIAPLTGSPAIDAGDNSWAPPFDQRGVTRPLESGEVDIGAVEGVGVTIVTNPASTNVALNATATFSVVASGESPLRYQWQFQGTNIAGATNATLTITNVTAANLGSYQVGVTNAFGGAMSAPAQLGILGTIVLTSQPVSQTVFAGSNVTFSASATASSPITWQWRFDGTNISGATSNTLVLLNVQSTNAGTYSAVATASGASVTTTGAVLTVAAPVTLSPQPVLSGNALALSFPAQTNVTYVIDRATSLSETNWVPWKTNVVLTSGWVTNLDATTNLPGAFYRLRVQ